MALIGINVCIGLPIWATTLIFGQDSPVSETLHRVLSLSPHLRVFAFHPWTLLTYMVTHFSFLHLLFNTLWLFWFGQMCLLSGGEKPLFRLYLGGGLSGGLFYLLISPLSDGITPGFYLCGASASVLALMTYTAIKMPEHRIRLFLFGEVRLKWFAAVCILLTFFNLGGGSNGGQLAHIGGVAFGAAYALAPRIRRALDKMSRPVRKRKRGKSFSDRDVSAMIQASSGRLSDPARLDELLDKIRVSGYASLSNSEKAELDAISKRLSS